MDPSNNEIIMLRSQYLAAVEKTLETVKARNYSGFEKFDALSSPVLELFSLNNPWLRFIFIQAVKECPFHIRPLLGVKQSRNPKGIALFARAYFFLYEITHKAYYLQEGLSLLKWLLDHPSPRHKNLCWGYDFLWQSVPPFCQDRFEPNVVVTCFVGEALVHGFNLTKDPKFVDALSSVSKFLTEDLPVLHEDQEQRAIAYILSKVDSVVLNNQVMSASLLCKIGLLCNHPELITLARKQMVYTDKHKTNYFAWPYAVPLHSKRTLYIDYHDNYHTGGLLDAFLEYFEITGDDSFQTTYWQGLEYYANHLFETEGAPRWTNRKRYPYDIHSSAQGIISFTKASQYKPDYLALALRITEWTFRHLYRKQHNDFAYRKGRWMLWNYSLIRWCNGWMTRALGELAFKLHQIKT